MNTALVLTLRTPIMTNLHTLEFQGVIDLDIAYESLTADSSHEYNVSDLISKRATNFKNVVCFLLWTGKYCDYCNRS